MAGGSCPNSLGGLESERIHLHFRLAQAVLCATAPLKPKWPPFFEQLGSRNKVMKWSAPLHSRGLESQNERGFQHNEADREGC